jgi:hypothetical protein
MLRRVCICLCLAFAWAGWADTRGAEAIRAPAAEEIAFSGAHALVIGIDAYAGGWPRLRNAVADAEAVAEALAATGFDTVTLLRDPDRAALLEGLEAFVFGPAADASARVLIWFAGHGHTIEGIGYLVPPEAPMPADAASDAAFRRLALSMPQLESRFLREMRARHVLGIFDACFAGTVFSATRAAAVVPPSVGFAARNRVVMLVTSGQEGEEVRDDGLFRQVFVDALTGADPRVLTEEGYLLGSRLGAHLATRVADYSDGFQHPAWGTLRRRELDRGDFLFPVRFAPPGAGAGAEHGRLTVPPVPVPAPVPVPVPAPVRAERVALLSAPGLVQPEASALGAPLARLRVGARVTVLGEAEGNWWRVRLPDGREGWLSRTTSLNWIAN